MFLFEAKVSIGMLAVLPELDDALSLTTTLADSPFDTILSRLLARTECNMFLVWRTYLGLCLMTSPVALSNVASILVIVAGVSLL